MTKYNFDCGCEVDLIDEEIKGYDQLPSLRIDYEQMVEDLNYEQGCPRVWELLGTGKAKGVFQLETQLGQNWAKRVEPSSLEEMAALISIIRPGCLQSLIDDKSITQHYVDRKHGKEAVKYFHSELEEFLKNTYALLIFQEQAMKIAQGIAGFDEKQADSLRKSIGKKLPQLMAENKKEFIKGAKQVGKVNEKEAEEIFGWIEKSQRYSFNACLTGDTIIKRANTRKKYIGMKIEEMYKIRNDISYAKKVGKINTYKQWKFWGHYGGALSLNDDRRLRRNIIKDIRHMGEKPVFRIILEDGSYVDVTSNHKFPTRDGEKRCDELSMSDCLFKCGKYEESDFKKLERFSSVLKHQREPFKPTNGSYTLYKQFKDTTPNICAHCQSTKNIEVHHINKDRTNSKPENLVKLCSSCHKKEEYKSGRVKRGEKGYPSYLYKIKSIEEIGIKDVYDVEMAAPYHNFVTGQDIVTCNSHGISYGSIGYLTAWVKTHFPLHFYCSWIKYARNKQKAQQEVKELVKDARAFNIDVYTPTVESLWANEADVCIDIDKIVFGIRSVKNMGRTEVEKFLKTIKTAEEECGQVISDMTWLEFLIYIAPAVRKTTVNNLISVGMFDYFDLPRQKMLYEYELCRSLTKTEIKKMKLIVSDFDNMADLINYFVKEPTKTGPATKNRAAKLIDLSFSLVNPSYDVNNDDPKWIMRQEMDLIGTSLSYSAIDTVSAEVSANTTCAEFENGKKGDMVIAGEVISSREYKTKNGNMMGFASIEDNTGQIDAVIFPEAWESYSYLLFEGSLIHCAGYRSDQDSFVINKIFEI